MFLVKFVFAGKTGFCQSRQFFCHPDRIFTKRGQSRNMKTGGLTKKDAEDALALFFRKL